MEGGWNFFELEHQDWDEMGVMTPYNCEKERARFLGSVVAGRTPEEPLFKYKCSARKRSQLLETYPCHSELLVRISLPCRYSSAVP